MVSALIAMYAMVAGPFDDCTLEPGPDECPRQKLVELNTEYRQLNIDLVEEIEVAYAKLNAKDDEIEGLKRLLESERNLRLAQSVPLTKDESGISSTCLAVSGAVCAVCGAISAGATVAIAK